MSAKIPQITTMLADLQAENLLLQDLYADLDDSRPVIEGNLGGYQRAIKNLASAKKTNPYTSTRQEHIASFEETEDNTFNINKTTTPFSIPQTAADNFLSGLDALRKNPGYESRIQNESLHAAYPLRNEKIGKEWKKEGFTKAEYKNANRDLASVVDPTSELAAALRKPLNAPAGYITDDKLKELFTPSQIEDLKEEYDAIDADEDLNWYEKYQKKVDVTLEYISQGADAVTQAMEISQKYTQALEKTGLFPLTSDIANKLVGVVRGASQDISKAMKADFNELSMDNYLNEGRQNSLAKAAYSKDIIYPDFVNNAIEDIVLEQDAFTHKFIAYLATVNYEGEDLKEIPVDYEEEQKVAGQIKVKNYPYYYYMDKIQFAPTKKATSKLKYGAFETTVALLKPDGKNTFSFTLANDISLKLWRKVKSLIGANNLHGYIGNGITRPNYALIVIIPSYAVKDNNEYKFCVQKFVLNNIDFTGLQPLDFKHDGGQSKTKIDGICSGIYWYPNAVIKQKTFVEDTPSNTGESTAPFNPLLD